MPEKIDPALWEPEPMREALAARDIPTVYQLLHRSGVTQREIARLTGQSQSEVSEIITGRREVLSYDLLVRIADGLGIPHGHMGVAYADAEGNVVAYSGEEGEGNPDPLEDDDVITRRVLGAASAALLGEAALDRPIMQLGTHLLGDPGGLPLLPGPSGDKLDKHDIAWIRTATDRFRELESEYGGMAAYAAVRGIAEQVVGALRSSSPTRDLYVAVSGLCRVAAWTAFDAGRKRDFWQCHATALDLAKQAGDIDTVILTIKDAGRVEIHSGHHRAAAKLFELTSVRRSLDAVTWGLLGSAYAPNSPEATKNALQHMRDARGADTPDAIAMSGHLNLDLGNYSAAAAAFKRALPMRSGVVAIQDTTPIAIAYLKAEEPRIGVQYAENALALAEKVRSVTATRALGSMVPLLAVQKDSTAQDMASRVTTAATNPLDL